MITNFFFFFAKSQYIFQLNNELRSTKISMLENRQDLLEKKCRIRKQVLPQFMIYPLQL